MASPKKNNKKNLTVAINMLMIVFGMFGMAYGSVPLYRMFCQITGFGGTTQEAQVLPSTIIDRDVKIHFDTNVDPSLDWEFKQEQKEVTVKVGENGLAFFTVQNNSKENAYGIATYNVTPERTGQYFNKIKCFCFDKQLIKAGERVEFPVSFFIAPEFASDDYMKDVETITLSYTFYRAKD